MLIRPAAPVLTLFAGLLAFAGCAGVSPRPGERSPGSLPSFALAAADQQRRDRLVDECVRQIVMRHYAEAEQAAVDALAIDPRSARARAVRGIVLLQAAKESAPIDLTLANEGEAEVVLAEQLAPEDPFVGWLHALFLAERGHLSAAAAAAEAALERCPAAAPAERAPLYALAGTYRYELGEERAALPLLESYVMLRPDDATANFRMGSCLLRMAQVPVGPQSKRDEQAQRTAERAARTFQRCWELAPGDEDAALAVVAATMRAAELAGKRGAAADRDRLLTAADAQAREAAERFPDSAEANFRVGVVAMTRDLMPAAEQAWRAALERDPEHLGSLLDLAAALGPTRAESTALLLRALAVDRARGGLDAGERRRIEQFLAGTSRTNSPP